MKYLLTLLLAFLLFSAYSQTIYVVRHAEKETADSASTMMKNDPPLTKAGKQRAEALKDLLKEKNIGYIFSTNTLRTRSTAEPTRAYFNLVTEIYQSVPDAAFIARIQSLDKNVLIIGHSNTVDDLVNKLCGKMKIPADLPDTAYDNLFVITKNGKKLVFENLKYGQ